MSEMLTGECACGGIRFEIEKTKANVVNCHCRKCRALNGAAYSTYYVVSSKRFNLLGGNELLNSYAPSEQAAKHFCRHCGTPVFNLNLKYPNLTMVHYGTLRFPQEVAPNVNIFCRSKLDWVELDRNMACYEQEMTAP